MSKVKLDNLGPQRRFIKSRWKQFYKFDIFQGSGKMKLTAIAFVHFHEKLNNTGSKISEKQKMTNLKNFFKIYRQCWSNKREHFNTFNSTDCKFGMGIWKNFGNKRNIKQIIPLMAQRSGKLPSSNHFKFFKSQVTHFHKVAHFL